jgi:hypothetical protein
MNSEQIFHKNQPWMHLFLINAYNPPRSILSCFRDIRQSSAVDEHHLEIWKSILEDDMRSREGELNFIQFG